MQRNDVVILGGGPAGMATALVAGRARLRTVVLNAESARNRVTEASHGYLTRDGAHADEMLSVAKDQLQKYSSVRYVVGSAVALSRAPDGFVVTDAEGTAHHTKRVVVATGYRDDVAVLGVQGLAEVYGKSVFPCPFCDGFEHADERIAVFGGEGAQHFVPVVRVWSADVAVFTNGQPLDQEVLDELVKHGVPVYLQPVARLHSDGGVLTAVQLADGTVVPRDAGFLHDDISTPNTDFAVQLGASQRTNDWGMLEIEADEGGATSVPGLYVVGDARRGFSGLMTAAADGSVCAAHIVHAVAGERWAEAAE